MTDKPHGNSLPTQMIELFELKDENGEYKRYTPDEMVDILYAGRQNTRYEYFKGQVAHCRSSLINGKRQKDQPPMNIQKIRDDDGIKRWRLVNDKP